MTYSFCCQDLSIAGKRAGMEKGSGTRSGLLWEVERLLNEVDELPQILIMENVPQVITAKGWREWCYFLESKGYSNYAEVLNAKNYGIPQNRERCFMVSILGNYNYKFPKGFKLKYRLKDLLEDEVDEKYYLSETMINGMKKTNFQSYKLENKLLDENGCANTIIARFDGTPQLVQQKLDSNKAQVINPLKNKSNYGWHFEQQFYDENGITRAIKSGSGSGNIPKCFKNNLRIRRLTPKECFKLMGVKPSDYDKLTVSSSQKYKQAGNSIVTTCLMAIYSKLFDGIDYKEKIDELLEELIRK